MTWDAVCGMWYVVCGMWDMGYGIWDMGRGAWWGVGLMGWDVCGVQTRRSYLPNLQTVSHEDDTRLAASHVNSSSANTAICPKLIVYLLAGQGSVPTLRN